MTAHCPHCFYPILHKEMICPACGRIIGQNGQPSYAPPQGAAPKARQQAFPVEMQELADTVTVEEGTYRQWKCYTYLTAGLRVTITKYVSSGPKDEPEYVNIPSGINGMPVTEIWSTAFFGCDRIEEISLPASVTKLQDGALSGMRKLISIAVEDGNPAYCSRNGDLYTADMQVLVCVPAGKTGKYRVPEGVTAIGYRAFCGCTGLREILLPASVKEIGNGAFMGCAELTAAVLPERLKKLGRDAFAGCRRLRSVTVPDTLPVIEKAAFAGCKGLAELRLPAGLRTVESYAFAKCTLLRDVYYSGTPEQWRQIEIGTQNECLTRANIHYVKAPPSAP